MALKFRDLEWDFTLSKGDKVTCAVRDYKTVKGLVSVCFSTDAVFVLANLQGLFTPDNTKNKIGALGRGGLSELTDSLEYTPIFVRGNNKPLFVGGTFIFTKEDLMDMFVRFKIVQEFNIGVSSKPTIYVAHSTHYNFDDNLYQPLRESSLNDKYNIILPHEDSEEQYNSKEVLRNCSCIIAEITYPSLGTGIEIGWADSYGVPVIGLVVSSESDFVSSSVSSIAKNVVSYTSSEELVNNLTKAIEQLGI